MQFTHREVGNCWINMPARSPMVSSGGHLSLVFDYLLLKSWALPPPRPLSPVFAVPRTAFLSVSCTALSLWYVQFLLCVTCVLFLSSP